MNYELARRLKDAGFPQPKGYASRWLAPEHLEAYGADDNVYGPTLEEIIEACGDNFLNLMRPDHEQHKNWRAVGHQYNGPLYGSLDTYTGSTPSEAVANLWMGTNGKGK